MLFPPSVEELIPERALVRVVDSIVDGMDRSVLESAYPGGGASAHDPSMMPKVILFCYSSGIYSSRKIAAATRENVNLMWLTGMHPLDHNTINRFRSERIRPVFEESKHGCSLDRARDRNEQGRDPRTRVAQRRLRAQAHLCGPAIRRRLQDPEPQKREVTPLARAR